MFTISRANRGSWQPDKHLPKKVIEGSHVQYCQKKTDDQILADPWGPKTLKNPCALKTNMFHSSVIVTSFNQDSIRETPRVRIPHDSTITQLRQIHQTVCVGHHGAVQEIPYGKEQKLSVCKVISWFCTGEIRSGSIWIALMSRCLVCCFFFRVFQFRTSLYQHLYQKRARICWAALPPPPPPEKKKKVRCWDDVEMRFSSQLCTSRRHWIFKQKTNILWRRRMSRKTLKVC